jgi:hypothetical protein
MGMHRIITTLVPGENFPGDFTDIFLGFAAIGVGRVDAAGLSLSNNHSRSPLFDCPLSSSS